MKDLYFMLTLLILSPEAPSKDMDVFLQLLINELKELWVLGVDIQYAVDNSVFTMRAILLWTMNDFPERNSLSGWSGQGYKACLTYNEDTPSLHVRGKNVYFGHIRFLPMTHPMRQSKKFNGKVEKRPPPRRCTTEDILRKMSQLPITLLGTKHMTYGGKKFPSWFCKKVSMFYILFNQKYIYFCI